MSLLKEIIAKEEEYVAFKNKTYTQENLELLSKEMFDKFKLDILVFTGYTPGFNDGDPCEHSSDWFSDSEMFYYIDGAEDGDFENYEDHTYKFDFNNPDKVNEYISSFDDYNSPERKEFIGYGSVLVDIMDHLEETDYKFIIYRDKDDQITIEVEEYTCGY